MRINKFSVPIKEFLAVILVPLLLVATNEALAGSYEDFFKAISNDDSAVVSNLIQQGFDPNTPADGGSPALIQAVKAGAVKVSTILINSKGIDLDKTNLQDENALMLAVFAENKEITNLLLSKGAEVNKTGWSPLHYAATKGNLSMIQLLIQHSAYIDCESPNGTTPLMMAARYGTPEATKVLIEEGADPTIRNNLNLDAVDFAQMTGNESLVNYLKTQRSTWIHAHDK